MFVASAMRRGQFRSRYGLGQMHPFVAADSRPILISLRKPASRFFYGILPLLSVLRQEHAADVDTHAQLHMSIDKQRAVLIVFQALGA